MHVSSACGEVAVVNEAQVLGADVDVVLDLIDEGSQYTRVAIGTGCREMRVQLSMRSVGGRYSFRCRSHASDGDQRTGIAYINPPSVHKSFNPRLTLIGDPFPR